MIILTYPEAVEKVQLSLNLIAPVTKLLQTIVTAHGQHYDPKNDGFLVIITPSDTDKSISKKLGRKWEENCFEGAHYDTTARCYTTMILRNNQFAISILIPDEPWLDHAIRERILEQL